MLSAIVNCKYPVHYVIYNSRGDFILLFFRHKLIEVTKKRALFIENIEQSVSHILESTLHISCVRCEGSS